MRAAVILLVLCVLGLATAGQENKHSFKPPFYLGMIFFVVHR